MVTCLLPLVEFLLLVASIPLGIFLYNNLKKVMPSICMDEFKNIYAPIAITATITLTILGYQVPKYYPDNPLIVKCKKNTTAERTAFIQTACFNTSNS